MTAIPVRNKRVPVLAASIPVLNRVGVDRLGVVFPLMLVWIFFEFGRPSATFKIPLVISLISLVTWVFRAEKQWTPTSWAWLVLIGVMALGVPFATNNFSAFWTTYDMAVIFVCICLPLQSLITSVGRVRLWFGVFLAVSVYVGAWAALHHGYGPGGGAMDENYVAAFMGLALAIAFFTLFAEKAVIVRVMLAFGMAVFVAAIALGNNPSRGGFLGLCAVALYCIWRSPRKLLGISVLAVAAIALFVVAGPAFWAEISTSTDPTSATADVRLEIWKSGLRMWKNHPILGVGAGNFKWAIGGVQTVDQFEHFQRSLAGSIVAHSMWVEALAELGLAGVLTTGFMVWRTWTNLGKMRNELMGLTRGLSADSELVRLRCYADALRAGIVAVLANGVFLSLFYYSHLWLLLALGSGMTTLYRARVQGSIPGAPQPPSTAGSAVRRRGAVLSAPALAKVSPGVRRRRGGL